MEFDKNAVSSIRTAMIAWRSIDETVFFSSWAHSLGRHWLFRMIPEFPGSAKTQIGGSSKNSPMTGLW